MAAVPDIGHTILFTSSGIEIFTPVCED